MRNSKGRIKKVLKSNFLFPIFDNVRDGFLYHKRKPFIKQLRSYIHEDTTVISSNCFAGRIMQDLGMQYNSPTLGLYFFTPDYIKFLSNLRYYLTESKLEFVNQSRYEIANKRREKWSHWYPIGLLSDNTGGVEIEFLHYHSEEEAAEKWKRRAARINWNDLIIIAMDMNLCTNKHIEIFDRLPYKHKVFFSTRNLPFPSNIEIKEFSDKLEVGDPYKKGHIFYKYLVEYFNSKL